MIERGIHIKSSKAVDWKDSEEFPTRPKLESNSGPFEWAKNWTWILNVSARVQKNRQWSVIFFDGPFLAAGPYGEFVLIRYIFKPRRYPPRCSLCSYRISSKTATVEGHSSQIKHCSLVLLNLEHTFLYRLDAPNWRSYLLEREFAVFGEERLGFVTFDKREKRAFEGVWSSFLSLSFRTLTRLWCSWVLRAWRLHILLGKLGAIENLDTT